MEIKNTFGMFDPEVHAEIEAVHQMPKGRLVAEDLKPTRLDDRNLTAVDMGIMWVGMSVLLTTFTIGSTLYPSLSVASILWAAALGNFIVIVVMLFTGDIGIKYGIPMAVYLRAVYGTVGTHVPSVIRSLPAMFWFGFQSFLGASAINSLLYILTDGGWPGNFVTMLIVLIIFIFVQAYTTARGVNAIAWFEKLVSPLMIAIALYMLYWIMTKAGLSIGDILSVPAGDVGDGPQYSFGYAVTSCTGYWATMSINIMDLTRFMKVKPTADTWFKQQRGLFISQTIGIITTIIFFCFLGVTAMVATGLWNPVDAIVDMGAPILLTCGALIIAMLAQWSTNIAANILPPANIWANVFAPKIGFKGGCAISGIIAFGMCTWAFGNYLVTVFAYIGAGLGGIAGSMIADYYMMRGRKLKLTDLYKTDGQYKYANGWNPCGFIAYAVGFICGLLIMDWSFIVSAIVAGVVYSLTMRFWGAKKYNQTEIIERFNIK